MLFLVISTPRPERSTEVAASRQKYWSWIRGYQTQGVCKHVYPRVGRGVVAVFDVDNNMELHRILNEWGDLIPAQFDTYPLIDPAATEQLLAAQVSAAKAAAADPEGS